jgi:hypothetical protein
LNGAAQSRRIVFPIECSRQSQHAAYVGCRAVAAKR